MNWTRLCCRSGEEAAWELADRLEALGALGVSLVPSGSDERLHEPAPHTLPLTRRLRVEALFGSRKAAEAAAAEAGIEGRCSLETLCDRNWVAEGERGFVPQRFGKRLWIVPEWCEPPEPEAVNVLIAPGLAFGTGAHPTTALCLAWLANFDLAGQGVIDYGCGSGVLAVAAARLGAEWVCAVDNDPQACMAARANAKRNQAAVTVCAPDELPMREADVLVANILARPLIALVGELCARTRVGGRIVLSGMTAGQVDAVAAAYASKTRLGRESRRAEWRCLELLRDGAGPV
ncbi:MAG: 50S ribosomal protein L11 methyltransferase [Gammaproteobacteria bacterium]|nr:50S ribosomal protein L11 methyltransferase [Gammaproteobacteria bacterium]